jgi:outer membrane protein
MSTRKLTRNRIAQALLIGGLAFSATAAQAYQGGDWLVRGRLITIQPNDSSGPVSIAGAAVPGSGVTVGSATTLDIDITRMLTPNWGVELLLDPSTKHDIDATGSALGGLGTIVTTRVLPPALILQYHFAPNSNVRPYAGVGVNYTLFFNEDATNSLKTALGGSADVSLKESWGLAAQAGVDVDVNKDWFVNLDVKYIDMSTKANISSPAGVVRVNADINPWVFGVGLGRRF